MRTIFLVLALVVCVSGCRGSSDPITSNPDLTNFQNMVGLVGDTDGVGWAQLFVEGAAPADSKPYGDHIFTLPAEPKVNVSGDSAEIDVLVLTEVNGEEQEVTVTWTAQKIGDKWKLKTAPLP